MRAKQKEGQRKLTAELLRQLLSYDPATGRFTRLVAVSGLAKVGDIAGTESGGGYVQICIDRVRYFAHRLAWLYMTGEWPKNEIDHINWVRNDNRWSNLRDVTRLQNRHNRRPVTTAAPNP